MSALALDIGGANMKAAFACANDDHVLTNTVPFALWKEPQHLGQRLDELAGQFPPFDRLLVTMTAELCDCFATKREGVNCVLDAVAALATRRPVGVWSTVGRFVSPADARATPLAVAAANWHALATFVAGLEPVGRSLLIDTGSTTTDVIRLVNGRVEAAGLTDTARLASGELVYLGALRTPLAALGPAIEWRDRSYALMAELFATTGDVFLLTGDIPEQPDRCDTADGRPMTRAFAAARIVRMIGADLEMLTLDDARDLAFVFSAVAVRRIAAAIERVSGDSAPGRAVISGGGDFLASMAVGVALPDVQINRLADRIGAQASAAACAFALLRLADHTHSD